MEEIRDALSSSSITSLTGINLRDSPAGFDSESKCSAWAAVIKKQTGLQSLYLNDCNITGSNQAIIKQACPQRCNIYGF